MQKLLLFFVVVLSFLGTSNAMKRLTVFDLCDEYEPVLKCPRPQDEGALATPEGWGNNQPEIADQRDSDDDQDPEREDESVSDNESDAEESDSFDEAVQAYTNDSKFLFWAVQNNQVDIVREILHNECALGLLTVFELELALNNTQNIAITRALEWAIEKKSPNWAEERSLLTNFLRLHV